MNHFLIVYYKTKEHYEGDAYFILGDKFYSEKAYIDKVQDLMYRFFYYRLEVYRNDDLKNPIRNFSLEDFNRKQYRDTNFKY